MRRCRSSCWFLAAVVALPAVAWGQTGSVASADPVELRIEILGASVSAGFEDGPLTRGSSDNRTVPLHRVLRSWLDGSDATINSRADLWMFQDPLRRGAAQVDRALRQQPGLVFAVDFLFWYAFGQVAGADEGKVRREHLAVGLAQLDRLSCPMVIGDLPDVRGASARMINVAQMPAPELLAQLNEVIVGWARSRPRVRLFPLREFVATMKEVGVALPLADGVLQTQPGALLQGDRLHATTIGMAWLGCLLQEPARLAVSTAVADGLPRWTFPEFVRAIDADAELEELRAASGSAAAASRGR